ncbi:MAG: TonB-dependent receptor, partial [Gemmatimonadales bacterium]|nr:TonB-dependent receptor [Gemmatimonadales bacterium]
MYSFRFSPASTVALLLAATVAAPPPGLAQGGGRVIGVVRDRETGQPVEGANLLLAGTPRVQLTDNAGRFVFLGMTLGEFVLVVRRVGYEALSVRGRVSGAAPSELTILLHPTATPTLGEIEVSARPFQRTDEPASVQTVDRQQLRLAPITTLTDVIDIQAGVADGHFRGGRTGQAILMIDGLDVRDQFALSDLGTTMNLSPTAIEELSVVTGGFGAQYGNALSGVVDVATRSGSPNHWETRASLNGGQLLPDRIGYGQSRTELSAGGPLRFLGSGVTVFMDGTASTAEDAEPRLHGLTCLTPSPGDRCLFERAIIPHHRGDQLTAFSRIDFPVSPVTSFTLTGLWTRGQQELYSTRFKYNLDNYLAERRTSAHVAFSAQHQTGGGSRASLLTARVALTRAASYLGVPVPGDRPGTGGLPWRRLRFRGEDFVAEPVEQQIQEARGVPGYVLSDDFTGPVYGLWGRGLFVTSGTSGIVQRHQTDMLTVDLSSTTQVNPQHLLVIGGTFKLIHVQAYERTAAALAASSPSAASFFPRVASLYLTNTLKPVGGATLTLGARLEAFNPRIQFTTDRRTLGAPIENARWTMLVMPRIGFVMPLTDVGLPHTVARWNFGISSQPPAFQFFFDSGIDDSLNTTLRRQGNPALGFERATSYEAGITQLLTPDVLVGVTGYYKDLSGLVTSGVPLAAAGRLFSNLDQGRIYGVEASLDLGSHPGRKLRLSYSFQQAKGTVSTPFDSTSATPGTRAVDVPLAFDRRHAIDLLAIWAPPEGRWSASLSGTAGSGYPIPGRDDGRRLPWSVLVNGRLTMTAHWHGRSVEFYAEGRNLLAWRTLRTARPETGNETVVLDSLEAR